MLAAIFQIPDAIGFSAIGSLRGHKDTFATMVIMIISYCITALPLGMFLAFNENDLLPAGAQGIWIGMIFGIIVSAVLNSMRLRYKKNKLKKLFKV
jgi:MATE family multidrug resistance protein